MSNQSTIHYQLLKNKQQWFIQDVGWNEVINFHQTSDVI